MQGQTASYVLSTLVIPPLSAGLANLATVKDELDIVANDTSNDARLTRYIAQSSADIARYCNRIFGLATWTDEFRPQHSILGEGTRAANNPLKLTRWPLQVGGVLIAGNTHSNQLIDGIATASTGLLFVGMPIYGSGIQGTNATPVFGAGIAAGTTIAAVQATGIILSAPMTVTASGVSFTAGLSVVETSAGISTQLIAGVDFEVDAGSMLAGDEGAAQLYRLNDLGNPRTWSASQITVTYQAGYALPSDTYPASVATLPSDLESTCLDLVIWSFRRRGRDPLLVERTQPQTIGSERYWVGATPGQIGPYPNEIMATLNSYRQPVVAAA
jgi:hypothetical protein